MRRAIGVLIAILATAGLARADEISLSIYAQSDYISCPPGTGLHQVTKLFQTLSPVKIKMIEFLPNATRQAFVDYAWTVTRHSDHKLIYSTNWDHYREPTAPQRFPFIFPEGDYVSLSAGDGVDIWVGCVGYGLGGGGVALATMLYGAPGP